MSFCPSRTIATLGLAFATSQALPVIASDTQEIVSEHAVAIDPDQPFPSVMFSDILKSMSDQVFWENGQMRFFERVRMTFLPEFQDPQHIAPYNAGTGAFLVSRLATEGGAVQDTVFWEARKDRFPYWTVSAVGNSDPRPLAAGEYTLTWMIDGAPFWAMAFEVSESAGGSAYDQPKRFLEGPWSQWAYIYVPNGNLGQNPTFNVFLRDKAAKPGSWVEKKTSVEVLRDGELVAQHGMNHPSSWMAKPWWIAQELALRTPDDSGFVSASDILSPGDYTVILRVNGDVHAEYSYRADGGIPFTGRQDREQADPMEFLEGAQDRFFIARSKGD